MSGARLDLGQTDAALAELQIPRTRPEHGVLLQSRPVRRLRDRARGPRPHRRGRDSGSTAPTGPRAALTHRRRTSETAEIVEEEREQSESDVAAEAGCCRVRHCGPKLRGRSRRDDDGHGGSRERAGHAAGRGRPAPRRPRRRRLPRRERDPACGREHQPRPLGTAASPTSPTTPRAPRIRREHLRGLGLDRRRRQVVTSPQAAVRLLGRSGAGRLDRAGGRRRRLVATSWHKAGFSATGSARDAPAAVIQGLAPHVGWDATGRGGVRAAGR